MRYNLSNRCWNAAKSPLPFQPQPQPITRRVGQVLLYAKVFLSRLDRGMAQAQLNLVKPRSPLVRQLCESPPQVVGGYAVEAQ